MDKDIISFIHFLNDRKKSLNLSNGQILWRIKKNNLQNKLECYNEEKIYRALNGGKNSLLLLMSIAQALEVDTQTIEQMVIDYVGMEGR